MDPGSLRPYLEQIQKSGLNMIVIDMKDDYGRLRFTPKNSAISAREVGLAVNLTGVEAHRVGSIPQSRAQVAALQKKQPVT
jgi:hypothetical protein